ncbi:hypothetical protein DEO72_LG1g2842 [Vigna unguiculata]|uniref:Uncharacterized protein n=1 Tax=Vigna unguiculata TaxID=3917 RepID=A0A4D6KRM9_VIGUN|nr:hypothetical protein DEO72_LG1g2842 [Vigna unguiculata]
MQSSRKGKRAKSNVIEEDKAKEVVHVRAIRGQATHSHNLAERLEEGKSMRNQGAYRILFQDVKASICVELDEPNSHISTFKLMFADHGNYLREFGTRMRDKCLNYYLMFSTRRSWLEKNKIYMVLDGPPFSTNPKNYISNLIKETGNGGGGNGGALNQRRQRTSGGSEPATQ